MEDNYTQYLANKHKEAPLPADYTFEPKIPKRPTTEEMTQLQERNQRSLQQKKDLAH